MLSARLEPGSKPHRRGVLLIETVVCGVLLAVVTAILVPALMGVRRQRQAMQQESLVLVELNNQEERLRVQGSDQSSELSDWFLKQYPGSTISIEAEIDLDLTSTASTDFDEKSPPTESDVDQDAQEKPQNSAMLQARRLTIRCPMPASQPEFVRSVVVWIPGPEVESAGAAEPLTTAVEVTP